MNTENHQFRDDVDVLNAVQHHDSVTVKASPGDADFERCQRLWRMKLLSRYPGDTDLETAKYGLGPAFKGQ